MHKYRIDVYNSIVTCKQILPKERERYISILPWSLEDQRWATCFVQFWDDLPFWLSSSSLFDVLTPDDIGIDGDDDDDDDNDDNDDNDDTMT